MAFRQRIDLDGEEPTAPAPISPACAETRRGSIDDDDAKAGTKAGKIDRSPQSRVAGTNDGNIESLRQIDIGKLDITTSFCPQRMRPFGPPLEEWPVSA